MKQENINGISLPITGTNKITNILACDERAKIEITGTAGTITFRQGVTGANMTQVDTFVMVGTNITIPLYNMTTGTYIELETTGTITEAVIKWGH